jgi:hypothetical protein
MYYVSYVIFIMALGGGHILILKVLKEIEFAEVTY